MKIQKLRKQYDGKMVVDGVSFEISRGKVLSMIGPNGAGKSTVMGMISRLIAQDTDYILLDEPTNNLDIYHATNMMKIIRRLCDDLGKTVILVLHEINYAAFYSDYICAFRDGKIARFGTVEEVMTREVLSQIYQVDFEIMEIKGRPMFVYY